MTVLKKRILTIVVLIPVVLALLMTINPIAFALITALITALAAWEWSLLINLNTRLERISYIVVVLSALIVAGIVPVIYTLLLSVVGWIIAFLIIMHYAKTSDPGVLQTTTAKGIAGLWVLVPFWLALNALFSQPQGDMIVLLLLILVWAADIAAYLFGKKYGQRKLIPAVSPGKTVEGLYGALATTFIITLIGSLLLKLTLWQTLSFVFLVLLTVLFSVVGDLFESVIKRLAGVKNSSEILPGHGGILDRIDSLTAAAPLFAFAILGLGIGS